MKYIINENNIIITINNDVKIYGSDTQEYKQLCEYFYLTEHENKAINEREARRFLYRDKIKAIKKQILKNVTISDELKEKLNDTKN